MWLLKISEFRSVSGSGVLASFQEKKIFVGNVTEQNRESHQRIQIPGYIENKIAELESLGKTIVGVIVDGNLIGLIAVSDSLRENAKVVVNEIKKMNKSIIMMSGDNIRTANAIASQLGINNVMAKVSPENKANEIAKLQNQGKKVIMIGDGINDAPALAQANVGIVI